MKWKCLFGHDWQLHHAKAYRDISYGYPGVLITKFLYICNECEKVKVDEKYGAWEFKRK